MNRSPWAAILITYILIVITAFLTIFLPETLPRAKKRMRPVPEELEEDDESISQTSMKPDKAMFTWDRTKATIDSSLQHVKHALDLIRHSRIVAISVFACFAVDFARGSLLFVLQYISERYSLTLSQVS
jgi:hypothetical protein